LYTQALNNYYVNTYLKGIDSRWVDKIADTTWYVGGMTTANGVQTNAQTAYNYELGANKDANTKVTNKIGIMYLSEYYYAASQSHWTKPGNSSETEDYREAISYNWIHMGINEWTISRASDFTRSAFMVYGPGYANSIGVSGSYVIRPTFNLTSTVEWSGVGNGTKTSPYRIVL